MPLLTSVIKNVSLRNRECRYQNVFGKTIFYNHTYSALLYKCFSFNFVNFQQKSWMYVCIYNFSFLNTFTRFGAIGWCQLNSSKCNKIIVRRLTHFAFFKNMFYPFLLFKKSLHRWKLGLLTLKSRDFWLFSPETCSNNSNPASSYRAISMV